MPEILTYKQLTAKHPDYDADYWAAIRGLYEGGKTLLHDKALMDRLFPKHANEREDIYKDRRGRAFFIPYPSQIVDQLVAGLSSDPLTLEAEGSVEAPYYEELFEDTTLGRSRRKVPFSQFVGDIMRDALCFRVGWALVDLPTLEGDEPDSRADEERRGLTDAYLCRLEPEAVLDFERDDEDNMTWAMTMHETRKRSSPTADRSRIRQEFLLLDRDTWARYIVEFTEDEKPKDEDEFAPESFGAHSFGRVPLVPLDVPAGLWAMNKIAAIAVEHFNKRNALAWGEYKSLFQMVIALLTPPSSGEPISEDTKRAVNQPVGPGRVWVGSEKDTLAYLSPEPEPFRVALESLRDLRDEMFRVVAAMAMSVDNSGAALQRSGESKAMDQSSFAVVLGKLGDCARPFAVELVECVSQGRGERKRDEPTATKRRGRMSGASWEASGMSNFDDLALTDVVDDAVKLSTVDIPSPLFHTLHATEIARRVLGERATDDDMKMIKQQLEVAFASDATAAGVKAKGGEPPPDPIEVEKAKAEARAGAAPPNKPAPPPA